MEAISDGSAARTQSSSTIVWIEIQLNFAPTKAYLPGLFAFHFSIREFSLFFTIQIYSNLLPLLKQMPNVNIDKRSEQTAEDAQVDENDWVLLDPDADHCGERCWLSNFETI